MKDYISRMLHVWYAYLHLGDFQGKWWVCIDRNQPLETILNLYELAMIDLWCQVLLGAPRSLRISIYHHDDHRPRLSPQSPSVKPSSHLGQLRRSQVDEWTKSGYHWSFLIWLVVYLPLWKKKHMKVKWDDYSQYMEKHVPNHQPVMVGASLFLMTRWKRVHTWGYTFA